MNLQTLLPLALKASIALNVFALGLNATFADTAYLFRRPAQLAKALLAMDIVMPVFAAFVVSAFDLHPALKIALVALSVSPIPPILPKKALKAGGTGSYTIGLLVAISLLAIVVVPIALLLLAKFFGIPMEISPETIGTIILTSVLAPLVAGVIVNRLAPKLAEKAANPLSVAATVVLVAGSLPILVTLFPAIRSLIGNGTLVAIAGFVIVGLLAGHLLGGPNAEDRPVLALSTSSRHPGIAIAIAHANFPQQKLAMAAVLLYLIVSAVVVIPYLKWSKRRLP